MKSKKRMVKYKMKKLELNKTFSESNLTNESFDG